jgi:TPR repeat protein
VTDPAKEWYRKAAEGGNEKAAEALKRPGGE